MGASQERVGIDGEVAEDALAQLDLVLAMPEIGDDIDVAVPDGGVEDEAVAAVTAGKGVSAGAAIEEIVSLAAVQPVISASADEGGVAGATIHGVVAFDGLPRIIAGDAVVHGRLAHQLVEC